MIKQPFRNDIEARIAISAWLKAGAEIVQRCRLEGFNQHSCLNYMREIALTALRDFDTYRGIKADPLECESLRAWAEKEIGL